MKLKIMQQGGGLIYTPFIPQAQVATSSASGSSSSSSESKLDPLDKEILGIMKDQNLLPSDVRQIYDKLIKFQKQTQHLTALGDDSYRAAMPGMLQILGLVNEAKYNKTQSDNIVKKMAEENAGADPALDAYGRMYVRNKDKDWEIEQVSISDFDREKHVPISNSELLSMRQRQFGFQDKFMNDLENMVGMTTTQKEIDRIINEIGSAETSAYIKNPSANRVIQALMQDGPEGIYKLSQKDRSEGLQPAWNAIYQRLPQNMRNLLRANAALLNTDPLILIQDSVLRNSDTKTDISYESTASKAAGYDTDPNKTASEQLTQNNYLMQIGTRRLAKTRVMIVPKAAKISDTGALIAQVYTAGMPVDKNMQGIGMMTLSNFRVSAEAAKAGDFSSVTFGNRILKPNEYDAIVYDGNSELNIAMLPYTHDSTTGQLKPDFNLLSAFNYIQECLSDNPNISKMELEQKAKERGYTLEQLGYDYKTNTMTLKDTMPFLTFSAYASKDAINISKGMTPFLEKIHKSDAKQIMDKYDTLITYGTVSPSKNDRKLNNFDKTERWDLYRGGVFIPMTDAARALLLSGIGEYMPKSMMTDYAARVEARRAETQMNQMAQTDPNYEVIASLGQFK